MLRPYVTILELLTPDQRWRFGVLVAMMIAMGLLDVAGVASVLPFLAVLANPQVIETRPALDRAYTLLGFQSTEAFLLVLGLGVFAVVILGLAMRALTFYYLTRFARGTSLTLGTALLKRYLSRPYEWFLNQHSADLGKSVLQEVGQVVNGSIGPAMRLIANGIVTVFLVGLLLWVEPLGAIVVALLLGGCFGLIYAKLRPHLDRIGADRKVAVRERYQVTAEAMGGIKEVKILGLEDAYLRRFFGPSKRLARHQASVSLVGEMPRYALEALSFGGMLAFVLYLLWSRSGALEDVLPVIGAFAFAALKLMPTVQALFRDVSQLRYGRVALVALHRDLTGPFEDPPAARDPGTRVRLRRALRLDGVRYRYPNADRDALAGLTLEIPAGSSAGFVGPTGAGKTTAIDVILGLLAPREGRLVVDDTVIDNSNLRAWQYEIGYVPQSIYLVDDTVAGNIAFGVPAGRIDREAVARAARLANLADFIEGLPEGYDTMVGEAGVRLSGGQRQRIGIARALYRDPDIVVFDEATSALDTVTERAVIDAIRTLSGQKTILMITHRLTTIAHCDHIFMLKDGRLAGTGDYASLSEGNDEFRTLVAAAG